jgi:RNA polymerase sigma-70 factor (ECF subfamily)
MAAPTYDLVEHFFRHEYGRLVAGLTRAVGVARLELVEDVVQGALVQALQSWAHRGVPGDPAGWLYRVARNAAVDALRRDKRWAELKEKLARPPEQEAGAEPAGEIADDQLRLLFACCHPALPLESQVALALKTLCGFSTGEIARGLLTTEANVFKRLARAKDRLKEIDFDPAVVTRDHLGERLEAVRTVVYLLFNEGYHSAQSDSLIRRDVCDEALRLARMLADHAATADPTTFALVSLICFHAARFDARIAGSGQLLLEDQDRSKWDGRFVREGMDWLVRSASGDVVTHYHIEAGILSKHAAAPTFAATDWGQIVGLYDLLVRIAPTPVHVLNRAVAVAQRDGPRAGLTALEAEDVPAGYYLWPAVVGELCRRAGQVERAKDQLTLALALVASPGERELILRRLAACEAVTSSARG